MTRRIALAILLVACVMLLVGLTAAYVAVRQTVLAELDASIVARAVTLLQQHPQAGDRVMVTLPPGDRYLIKTESGQTLARPPVEGDAAPGRSRGPEAEPVVLTRAFARTADGQRVRSLSIRYDPGRPAEPVTVVYSAPADGFHALLNRLAWVLLLVGSAGAMVTALVAIRTSRAALRPLYDTAEVIGSIDQHRLDRRIQCDQLPVELRPVANRLNDMLGRLEQSFARQKQFVSDAAHELRTPLAALRTTLEVALRQPVNDPARQRRAMERSLSSTRTLSRLAEVLLEQAKTDGEPATEPDVLDVAAILRDCCETADPLAVAKHVRIEREWPSWLKCRGSGRALSSIVTNLLSNAVEYSVEGETVRVRCVAEDGHIVLTVIDNGPGIAAEHLSHIFDPFYRADSSRNATEGHLGLGLFITRSHVERWGGRIQVQSQTGRGTSFVVTLPGVISASGTDGDDPPATLAAARGGLAAQNPQIHAGLIESEYDVHSEGHS